MDSFEILCSNPLNFPLPPLLHTQCTVPKYFSEDFPSGPTRSRVLFRKNKIRPNIWPWVCVEDSILKPVLCIRNATTRVAPDLLKALLIPSDTVVRRSAVDQEDLKPYWESNKRSHDQLFKDFTKHRKKTNMIVVFSHRPLPNILK